VRRYVRSGSLPAIKVGRRYLVRPEVLSAFLAAREVTQ
jgi:excisionase family DNA binding protein